MKSKRNGHAPFWRKSKNAWYVHHQGRMLSLGRDKDAAWAKWHELQTQPAAIAEPGKCLTIADLADAYRLYAELYYRKDGRPTSEAWIVGDALRRFCAICGTLPIHRLSPVHVERFQEVLVDDGLARGTVNGYCRRIRRMVRWAVAKRHLPGTILEEVKAVEPVKKGRALGLRAREHDPIGPVPQAHIHAIQPHVSAVAWGLIQFQLLTGARPGEALALRACDLNTQGEIWEYRPASHKTEHHGKQLVIAIGRRAQALLREFLTTDLQAPVFPGYRRDSYRNLVLRAAARHSSRWEWRCRFPTAFRSSVSSRFARGGQRTSWRKGLKTLKTEWRLGESSTHHANQQVGQAHTRNAGGAETEAGQAAASEAEA